MDRQVSSGAMAAIVAVVIVVLGFVAWRVFGSRGDQAQQQQQMQRGIQQDYMRQMRSGQTPVGVPPPGR